MDKAADQKAAEKAAERRRHMIEAAILAALLALRSKITTVIMWLPAIWDGFETDINQALLPLSDAHDEAAKSVWLGFDPMDPRAVDAEAAYRRTFATEFVAATRRGVEKILAWARDNGLSEADTAQVLEALAGVNQNQASGALSAWLEELGAGAAAAELLTLIEGLGRRAIEDRSVTVAGDSLWDAVMLGQLAAGLQEQRTTNALVVKTWRTAEDERVCTICGPLNRVVVPITEPFPGGYMMPTAHSHCRCFAEISVQPPTGE